MVRGSAFHPFCRALEQTGVDTGRFLGGVGIGPRFSGLNDPCEDFVPYRSISEFIARAYLKCGESDIGLLAGSQTSIDSIGAFGWILRGCVTVRELIYKIAEVMPTVNFGTTSWVGPGQEPGSLRFHHRQLIQTMHAHVDAYAIQIFLDAVRIGAGPEWRPKWIALHQSAGRSDHYELLGEAERDSLADYLAFDVSSDVLACRLEGRLQPEGPSVDDWVAGHVPPTELEDVLNNLICAGFGARIPSLNEAAGVLGMSSRTLRRRLGEQAISYRELVGRARIREAFRMLESGQASAVEVSRQLCYSDPANFTHAFRKWTGVPPSEYARR